MAEKCGRPVNKSRPAALHHLTCDIYSAVAKAERSGRQQPLADVSTPGHGQGEGPARYEFRGSGTKEIVGGAGANEVSGVPPGADCLEARSLHV